MKYRRLTCAVLFMLANAFPAVAQAPAPARTLSSLEQALIARENSLIEAKKKDDSSFFKRTLSPDFSFVSVDGVLHQQKEAVDELGDSGLLELTPYDIKVVTLSEDAAAVTAAIVTYDAIVREAPEEDQGPPPRYQHFTSVWVKQAGAWKLTFHQATAAHYGDW
jgi:hypothetical protein